MNIRMEDFTPIYLAARAAGKTQAAFIRDALLAAAQRTLRRKKVA